MIPRVYLSRRNLETLLGKLDAVKNGGYSTQTIVKRDTKNERYPQNCDEIVVTAVEDKDYYTDREPGPIYTGIKL